MRSVQSTLFALLAASSAAFADTTLNLTPGVSPTSHDIYELHMIIFWICVAIGILVFGVMAYAIIYHRKSRGAVAAKFHSHPWLEITWTIIPAIILILMTIPTTKVLLNMYNFEKEALTIKITGYQWKWHYEYLEDGLNFFSNLSTPAAQIRNEEPKGEFYLREVDNPIIVPIHKKIRFLITSIDVNHSWWVADLGIKKDAIAGFINEAWTKIDKPGTYRGQCAELCGINHAYMPIVVVAVTEQAYKDWVAKQKGQATQGEADTNREWKMDELMKNGEGVYNKICAACHQPGGTGLPPTFPALKGGPVPTGPIGKHIETVMNGVSGTAMQAFKNQLSDVELASVITYERNAWGNNTNTLVQPVQVKAYRAGKPMEEALTAKPAAESAPAAVAKPVATGSVVSTQGPQQAEAKPTTAAPAEKPVTSTKTLEAPAASANAKQPAPTNQNQPAAEPSPQALTEAIQRGEKVYLSKCAVCHQPSGLGMPPTFPALKGGPIPTGPVAKHIETVMNGVSGTAMQAFKEQLNDQDLADVITYERNAWGNNTGSLVAPDTIKKARQQPIKSNQ